MQYMQCDQIYLYKAFFYGFISGIALLLLYKYLIKTKCYEIKEFSNVKFNDINKAVHDLIHEKVKPNSKIIINKNGVGLNLQQEKVKQYLKNCIKKNT